MMYSSLNPLVKINCKDQLATEAARILCEEINLVIPLVNPRLHEKVNMTQKDTALFGWANIMVL